MDWNVFAYINDKVFRREAGAPDQQNPDHIGEDSDNDNKDICAQMLRARMAELEKRRQCWANGLRNAPAQPVATQVRSPSPSVETVQMASAIVDVMDDDFDELYADDPS
ncbi:hypothetical protein BD309DRAFT_1024437 [Dichomitus squalens]|nr:hypothetical protein BD309DRAFT_1024437 [Dichomitus squalens]